MKTKLVGEIHLKKVCCIKMLPILGSRITFLKRFALAISLGILFLGIVAFSWKMILNS